MQRGVRGVLAVISCLAVVAYSVHAQARTTLTVVTAADAAVSGTVSEPQPPLDDYRVYPADGPDGPPKVELEDRFQSGVVNLDPVAFFMAPVETDGGIVAEPGLYRACYQIWTGTFGASVDVDNRFGRQSLSVGDPAALCAPTEMSPGADQSRPRRDHYKCYEASGAPLADVSVDLSERFQNQTAVRVVEPFWFCTPASADGEGILNSDEYLTCYTTSASRSGSDPGLISVRNQFHESDVEIFLFEPNALCVPSSMKTCTSDAECDDENPCTDDSCSERIDVCVHTPTTASCVPSDACSEVGQCVDGGCEAVIRGVSDLVCSLDELRSVPCVEEELPKKLRRFISKKVKRVEKSLERAERAANKGKRAKADKLWQRATRQLESIPKRIRKASWRSCRETVEALVGERRQVIQEVASSI